MPKVTVYIPTYNYGQYLAKAIESVLSQKFDDWELIVINDGSTDNTEDILAAFHRRACQKHPKIKMIHQEKKGLTISNNIALRLSKGNYLMRLDADDILDENALLVLSNVLDTHPEVGLVYPDYYRMDEEGQIIDIERRENIREGVSLLDRPAHGACTMIRKTCLIDLGGYNETLTCQDGYDLWLRFIHKYKPYNVNIPLFYYRQHSGSLTRDKRKILSVRQQLKRNFVKNKFGEKISNVLAIIPVRKEPNQSPSFALRPLAGRPLIDYTVEEALKTPLLDQIVVTSNDEDLLGYIGKYPNVRAIRRPDHLALANSPIEPTVHFVLSSLKKSKEDRSEAVMLLYPTSPIRKRAHIEKAIDTMMIFNVESVISVCEDLNVYYRYTNSGLTPLIRKRLLRLEREALYQENGAIYLSKRSAITGERFLSEPLGHMIMLSEESIKIDSEFNHWLAEKIMKEWEKKESYGN